MAAKSLRKLPIGTEPLAACLPRGLVGLAWSRCDYALAPSDLSVRPVRARWSLHRILGVALLLVLPARAYPQQSAVGGTASEPAPASAVAKCDERVLAEAADAEWRLREKEWCDPADLALLSAGVQALEACAGRIALADRWVFPVSRSLPARSIGGTNGSGYRASRHLPCYATKYPGHPAHDLFVRDRHPTARDRDGRPFEALAAEEGLVLVARDGWREGDRAKGGNYVLLYVPARKWILYYAHLESIAVAPGERVAAGQVLGVVGRTGKNAVPHRSPTHLHFSAWDAATFRPLNPYKLLLRARPTL